MFRNLVMALGLTLVAGQPVLAQSWAARMFAASEHDFGNVARGAKAEYAFVFSNIYLEDVHVVGAHTSCGCTSVRIENPALKTYDSGAVVAILNTSSFQGQRGATIYVDIDKPFPATVELHVKGFIRSDVVVEPGSVQFGDMPQGAASKRTVTINCFGREDWKILDVRGTNSHVVVDLAEIARGGGQVSYQMTVNADKAMPSGYLSERVMLVTNDPESPQIPLLVEGRVLPAITVSPASLFWEWSNRATRSRSNWWSRGSSLSASSRSPATTSRSTSATPAMRRRRSCTSCPCRFSRARARAREPDDQDHDRSWRRRDARADGLRRRRREVIAAH